MTSRSSALFLSCLTLLPGCIGAIRETTTARAVEEMLFLSTAAQRAVQRLDPRALRGRSTWIELVGLEGTPERGYVLSALRERLAFHDVPLATTRDECDVLLEVRVATLGTYEADYKVGLPAGLPAPVPPTWNLVALPELALGYERREGRAGLRFFAIERRTGALVLRGPRLWGDAYKGFLFDDIWPAVELPAPPAASTGTTDAAAPGE